jgi:hypothetical protein
MTDRTDTIRRIVELERKADLKFAQSFPAGDRISTLDEEETGEYARLLDELDALNANKTLKT